MNPVSDFIIAACVPREVPGGPGTHAAGTLDDAESIRKAHPEVATASVHTAAILGDDGAVRRFIENDRANATAKGGPYQWDALTHLCFSRYLRLDASRADGFVRAATALLDAGASANTGFYEDEHKPSPEWEPVLYGAAGVAHHEALTRLLLARGAKPDDVEVVYHSPESYDNGAMQAIVETGKLGEEDLALMLIRKHDWHDVDGARWLLEHGASPKFRWRGRPPLHHALLRDNALAMIELLLDHGADATYAYEGVTPVMLAARRGRSDVLRLFQQRGVTIDLSGADRLIAACALGDGTRAKTVAREDPAALRDVVARGGELLSRFALTDNAAGVACLLDLGVLVNAAYKEGDGYFGLAPVSTALHAAAWLSRPEVVRLLIQRGARVNEKDARGRTALQLAVLACVDSYWTRRRTPDSVRSLLDAGASTEGVRFPSGYAPVDDLLRGRHLPSTSSSQ